jgi:hypothetical protein
MAGIIAAYTICLIYFDTINGKYFGILGDLSTLLGTGSITRRMWETQIWGIGVFQRGPLKLG